MVKTLNERIFGKLIFKLNYFFSYLKAMLKPFVSKFLFLFMLLPFVFSLWAKKIESKTTLPTSHHSIAIDSPGTKPIHTKKPAAPAPHYNYSKKSHMIRFEQHVDRPILQKVWFDTSAYYQFSDSATLDRFWLKAVGDYDYKATVFFKIIKANGTIIYRDSFPLMDLLGIYIDGGGFYATRTRKEEAMQQYVEEFFYESNLNITVNDLMVPVTEENYIQANKEAFENEEPTRSFVYSKVVNSQSLIGYNPAMGQALKFYEYK